MIPDFFVPSIILRSYPARIKRRRSSIPSRGKRLVAHAGAGRRVGWMVSNLVPRGEYN